jgi:hypothetical protein
MSVYDSGAYYTFKYGILGKLCYIAPYTRS